MKIGIVCNVENFYTFPEGDNYNYIKFIADNLSKDNNVCLFNWRDVSSDLFASKGLVNKDDSYIAVKNLDLNDYDVLFVKQLGKIHKESEKFINFLDSLETFKGKVLNPVKTMKDNLSKEYLLSMQKDNFPVIPTVKLGLDTTLSEVKKIDFNFEVSKGIVVKPCLFGESGQGIRLLDSFKDEKEFEEYLRNNIPVLAQPVIPEIFTHGEYSLVFLGKKFSHAIRKCTGKFKINFTPKSTYEEYIPTKEELNLAKKILDYWPSEIGYSRIDLMKHKDALLISEVEMVNPNFYIENLPGVGEKFIKDFVTMLLQENE